MPVGFGRKSHLQHYHLEPSHLLISNDPKAKLDHVFTHIHPKMVFAEGSDPPWNISRWKKVVKKARFSL